LLSRKRGRIFVIDAANIDWIGSESGLIFIHTKEEKYITNYTLEELESRLNPSMFFRAHRSAIVNLTRIKRAFPGLPEATESGLPLALR